MKDGLILELMSVEAFFNRSTNCLTESDADFKPTEGSLSVRQQVAHVAHSIDWFVDGMQSASGFDLNFQEHWAKLNQCTSLTDARAWFTRAIARAVEAVSSLSEADLLSPLPEGPVMGAAPKLAIVGGISDHTAHHRGALAVYSRLLGKEPKMPYMD